MRTNTRLILTLLSFIFSVQTALAQSLYVTDTGVGVETSTPLSKLDVNGDATVRGDLNADSDVDVDGTLVSNFISTHRDFNLGRYMIMDILPAGGTYSQPICWSPNAFYVGKCNSSSLKMKSNVKAIDDGLEIVKKLKPVTYNWKENKLGDVGLIAEEVAKVDSKLVFTNKDKSPEGVRYERIVAYLISAINQQQEQIEKLESELNKLNK